MAQTNTVSVFVQMTTVTASGVADRSEDCSKLFNIQNRYAITKSSSKHSGTRLQSQTFVVSERNTWM